VTGGASLYRASSKGFRLYLDRAPSPKVVIESSWRVNYIAYEGAIDCAISVWSTWSACSRLCGVGTKTRTRVATSPKNSFGSCPSLKEQTFCNPHACNTDCAASSWGQWSRCSASCGGGLQGRVRVVSRRPLSGGKACPPLSETQYCNTGGDCPVHCAVSRWSDWGACSRKCGGGKRSRARLVLRRAANSGTKCPALSETEACATQACAVDCVLAPWGKLTPCNAPGGHGDGCVASGTQHAKRAVLVAPRHGGKPCGATRSYKVCGAKRCDRCNAKLYGAFGACNVPCGADGTQSAALRAKIGGCPSMIYRACKPRPCAADCRVGAWSAWGRCTKECGGGTTTRMRDVLAASAYGGKPCAALAETAKCMPQPCPAHCQVGAWSTWTACTRSCGTGTQTATRQVLSRARSGGYTCPALSMVRPCASTSCPSDCVVTPFSAWTACTKTCGAAATKTRTRKVLKAASGGRACPVLSQVARCAAAPCPMACTLSKWGLWSACSGTCGQGAQTRHRTVAVNSAHGGAKCPPLTQTKPCAQACCPGTHGVTGRCSPCPAGTFQNQEGQLRCIPCSGGTYQVAAGQTECDLCPAGSASSKIAASAAHHCLRCPAGRVARFDGSAECLHCKSGTFAAPGSKACAPCAAGKFTNNLTGQAACYNTPQPCKLTQWGAWGRCSRTCGAGARIRTRKIVAPARFGAPACPRTAETAPCATRACAVDCAYTPFGRWSACTKSCGGGAQRRTRSLARSPRFGGKACSAARLTEARACAVGQCPVDCKQSAWGAWTACSQTCGKGVHGRSRKTTPPAYGGQECRHSVEAESCYSGKRCPVACVPGAWSTWARCSATCGTGSSTRARPVSVAAAHGGKTCGALQQSRPCNVFACPVDCGDKFTAWSACTKTCGGGKKTRELLVARASAHGGKACGKPAFELPCNTHVCAVHCEVSAWMNWSKCNAGKCGKGTQVRHRIITREWQKGGTVCPFLHETRSCNKPCAVDCKVSAFSAWSSCSASCGGGKSTRTRKVLVPAKFGGVACPGRTATRACAAQACPVDCVEGTRWTAWSACTKTCGTGHKKRTRTGDVAPAHGGKACPSTLNQAFCGTEACPADCKVGAWTVWTACTLSCGTAGAQRRSRTLVSALHGGKACPTSLEQRACSRFACAIDCKVEPFTAWSTCTKSCGRGAQARTRKLTPARFGGKRCPVPREQRACTHGACAVHCGVSTFSPWAACSKLCGKGGVQSRSRSVTRKAAHGGYVCPYLQETRTCNAKRCPFEATIAVTVGVGCATCASLDGKARAALAAAAAKAVGVPAADVAFASCAGAQGHRHANAQAQLTIAVTEAFVRSSAGSPAAGSLLEELFSSIDEAELHADTVARTLTNRFASAAGTALRAPGMGAELAKAWGRKCNLALATLVKPAADAAPVGPEHCDFSLWSAWSACSKKCGGGVQHKTRKVLAKPLHGGRSCPTTLRVQRPCRAAHCPADCEQSTPSAWTRCSKTCGVGTKTRTRRTTKPAAFGGKPCLATRETTFCNAAPCPVDCAIGHWTAWTACSKSCGFGLRQRKRAIAQVSLGGGQPCPHLTEAMECDAGSCPVNCAVSKWGSWTKCTATCGTGVAVRSRAVRASAPRAVCPSTKDVMDCNVQPCPVSCQLAAWSPWSDCTQPCGSGSQTRVRDTLVRAVNGGAPCGAAKQTRACNTGACPIDCVVGTWSPWTACPVTCGGARQSRVRSALVQPKLGGKLCASFTEVQTCGQAKCPVACKLGAWSAWSKCDRACGTGHARRARKVEAEAKYAGAACGALAAIKACNTKACAVDCRLGEWGGWGVCSTTCGKGNHSRQRNIVRERAHGGKACGALAQMTSCQNRECGPTIAVMPHLDCKVSDWGKWGACSATCGMGVHRRHRTVVRASRGGKACGSLEQVSACAPKPCPVDCVVTDWSLGACSVSCGKGTSVRARGIKVAAAHGGKACAALTLTEGCDAGVCPEHCRVSEFSGWSTCSATCGGGLQARSRHVLAKALHGGVTCPNLRQTRACGAIKCPAACKLGAWQKWSSCTKTCGTGRQWRIRNVQRPALYGGAFCAHTTEERACGVSTCPVDCIMGSWAWGACSTTCGGGKLVRTRAVVQRAAAGGRACGPAKDVRKCSDGPCPVHCDVTAWTKWSRCTKSCGGGKQRRSRTITTTAKHGGDVCPSLLEHRACRTFSCPLDCVVTSWGAWAPCTASCGGGSQTRARLGFTPPQHGGIACPAAVVSRACNTHSCPVHCELSAWKSWTTCTKTCGNGSQRRVRRVEVAPAFGGAACFHRSETRSCGAGPCPINCHVSPWGQWSSCTQTCGSGEQTRTRHITRQNGKKKSVCPRLNEVADCATDPCPAVHCHVSAFSAWSSCAKTCGGSSQRRTRSIVKQDEYGGKECPPLAEKRACGMQLCPVHCKMSTFSEFTPCSRTCGNTGAKMRSREILVQPLRDGTPCLHTHETATCNTHACPIDCVHTDFTNFDGCSKTCGWGVRTRTLSIVVAAAWGGKACPDTVHRVPCRTVECPVHCAVTAFGLWSACTRTCGGEGGVQQRTRRISTATAFGGRLCPHVAETRRCGNIECPVDCAMTQWGSYGSCSTSCAKGYHKRSRKTATREAWGGKACPDDVQTSDCNTANPCPVHCKVSPWQGWSACTKTCGEGTRARGRYIVTKSAAGGTVCPSLAQTENCNLGNCAVDCQVGLFQGWTPCSKSCGWGISHESRIVTVRPMYGGRACPVLKNSKMCMNRACPIDCVASEFSAWGTCSVTCGKAGKQERHRTLLSSPGHGGKTCPKMIEVQDCYLGACPVDCEVSAWASWSPCTKSCGVGRQSRSRSVERKLAAGGSICPHLAASRGCNLQLCPTDCVTSAWGTWEAAAYSKGDKAVMLRRSRDVLVLAINGGQACGELVQSKERECKEQNVVGDWSACSEKCGAGYQYRYREHVRCSLSAAVKYHVRFRQGQHCFVRACSPAELVASSAMRLDEEASGEWRTLSVGEAGAHGLDAGQWQIGAKTQESL
jgi:hypothetical protein